MPRKKKEPEKKKKIESNAYIEGAGLTVEEEITDTLEKNYMPYAMSVIISRALPEIDGFKPSHRKLLYTMYKMGLLTGARTKSANIVGQTMHLNPHGDQSIYDTMVRLTRGNETLLHPYIDSKGNFGKYYSSAMAYAASRYTEAKLAPICNELFRDIDKNTVDFAPNYDNTMQEPTLFPVTFPSVLVNSNIGIAVSMASSICPFNLNEVCETAIALMKDENADIFETMQGPDFPGGGFMIYNKEELEKCYETGRASIAVRSKWNYDKSSNCIEVTEIPYSTTVESIMSKVTDLIKKGEIREISYLRDETDLSGLKITFDLKRGTDPEKLMQKLFRKTPLQDNYSCNFNILINGIPRVMGVREILKEWTAWREECVKRRTQFDLDKQKQKLHILEGLQKILLDIDKAIKIVRETEEEKNVVPNLMLGFDIDETQAEYVAEIKLRHLNREYILNRVKEIEDLKNGIDENTKIIGSSKLIRKIIIKELREVEKKYGQNRRTMIYYLTDEDKAAPEELEVPDFAVHYFLSSGGYFKKIIPASLRMSKEMKWKEGDETVFHEEGMNSDSLLFFTNQAQVYKTFGYNFGETKASALGEYVPADLEFEKDEKVISVVRTEDYSGDVLFVFENGKAAKVPLNAYETKTNRKKLKAAYCDKSPIIAIIKLEKDKNIYFESDNSKLLIINSSLLSEISKRDSQGVQVMRLNKNAKLLKAGIEEGLSEKYPKAVAKSIPSSGTKAENTEYGQMEL